MDQVAPHGVTKPLTLVATTVAASIIYFASTLIYRLYFHPLSHIPGPWINAISRIPYARHLMRGTTAQNVRWLHDKYGEVVRLSPNEVSFITGETAWQEIYGFRTGKQKGHETMRKDPAWYARPAVGTNIIVANDEDHSRIRRTLAHAFSDKALAKQEVVLQQYVNLLIDQLRTVSSATTEPQDMCMWYNWLTFDVIADLTFNESFNCLRELRTHTYITLILSSLKFYGSSYVMFYWSWTRYLRSWIIDKKAWAGRLELYRWLRMQVDKRMALDTQRPDFMTEILKHNGEKGAELTPQEITNNAQILIAAGSETTATLLSAATYCLLRNPEVMQKLKAEIRDRFRKYDDITLDGVNGAPYLIAVLQEALRFFPPIPTGFERRVPKGGEVISGYYIPGETALCVSSWPLAHSERNFKDPDAFVPERWMGDPRFVDDNKIALQPFSFGPRNCLGKNLAYAEMRLAIAKIIWSFDLELGPGCEDWIERCKVFTVWLKPPLSVFVREAIRD